jgi:hypothetical protein
MWAHISEKDGGRGGENFESVAAFWFTLHSQGLLCYALKNVQQNRRLTRLCGCVGEDKSSFLPLACIDSIFESRPINVVHVDKLDSWRDPPGLGINQAQELAVLCGSFVKFSFLRRKGSEGWRCLPRSDEHPLTLGIRDKKEKKRKRKKKQKEKNPALPQSCTLLMAHGGRDQETRAGGSPVPLGEVSGPCQHSHMLL